MSFAKGLTEDQLAELMKASAVKERKAAARRDGRSVLMDKSNLAMPESSRCRKARGQSTRNSILEALRPGPIQSSRIEVGVTHTQVKQLLRDMLEEGLVEREYQNSGKTRIALWSLPRS